MQSYPAWIDEYAKSVQQAMSGMVPSKWTSLNGFSATKAYQGAFLFRINELVRALKRAGVSPEQAWGLFVHPSSLRSAFMYLIWEYHALEDKEPAQLAAREVFDWLDAVLSSGMRTDKWCLDSNSVHSPEEVTDILSMTDWVENDTAAVRRAAQLYVSTASLSFSLYRDFFPQEAHEIFGPYDASSRFGPDSWLIVKYFPKIRPVEVWPEVTDFPYEEVKIYQVIKDIHFRTELIGMHSRYDGPVIPNTVTIAVTVDGKSVAKEDIGRYSDEIAQYATSSSHLYDALDLSQAKRKFVEWESYQFIKLFEAAGMDWHPTPELYKKLEEADVPMGVQVDSFPSYDTYASDPEYEIVSLRALYQ